MRMLSTGAVSLRAARLRLEAYKLIPCVCFNAVLVLRAPNNASVVLQVLLVMQAPAYLNTAPMNAEVHVV